MNAAEKQAKLKAKLADLKKKHQVEAEAIEQQIADGRKEALKDLRQVLTRLAKDAGFTIDEVFPARSKPKASGTKTSPQIYCHPDDVSLTTTNRGPYMGWVKDFYKEHPGKRPDGLVLID